MPENQTEEIREAERRFRDVRARRTGDWEAATGKASVEEAEDAKVSRLWHATGDPWFRYVTLGGWPWFWWPCHWKGALLLLAGVVAMWASAIATIHFAISHRAPGIVLLIGAIAYLPFWLIGVRHAKKR